MPTCDLCGTEFRGMAKMVTANQCKRKQVDSKLSFGMCLKCYKGDHTYCLKSKLNLSEKCHSITEGKRGKLKTFDPTPMPKSPGGRSCKCRHCQQFGFLQEIPDFTYRVKQGHYATKSVPPMEIIGTRGCATCVGVIAIRTDKKVFCTHLDHTMSPADVTDAKKGDPGSSLDALVDSLSEVFPTNTDVREIHVTTISKEWVSDFTVRAIQKKYGVDKCTVHEEDAVYSPGTTARSADSQRKPDTGAVVTDGRVTLKLGDNKMMVLSTP